MFFLKKGVTVEGEINFGYQNSEVNGVRFTGQR